MEGQGAAELCTSADDCLMCAIVEERSSTPFVELFDAERPSSDQIVLADGDLVVIIDSAPIVLGHVLIATRRHVTALARATSAELQAVVAMQRRIERAMAGAETCRYVYFEHGPSADLQTTAGCGINHVHLHALPLPDDAFAGVRRDHALLPAPQGVLDLPGLAGDDAYLYIEEGGRGEVTVDLRDGSQLVRRSLARALADPTVGNWRDQMLFAPEYGTADRVAASLHLVQPIARHE